MAKAKVTVGFYTATRWNSFFSAGTAISEEKFEEYVQERAMELREDENQFESYLEDNYSCKEVFEMNEDEKAEVRKEYLAKCEDEARAEIEDDWEYNELSAEVEVPAGKLPKGKCPCPCNR
jgi:hypothetical protein